MEQRAERIFGGKGDILLAFKECPLHPIFAGYGPALAVKLLTFHGFQKGCCVRHASRNPQ
jgi:hypothetical protein